MSTLTVNSQPATFSMSGPGRTLQFDLPAGCALATGAQWVAAGTATKPISSAQLIVSYVSGPSMYLVPPGGSPAGAWSNPGQDLTPAQLAAVVALAGGTMSITLVESSSSPPFSDAWDYLRLVVTVPATDNRTEELATARLQLLAQNPPVVLGGHSEALPLATLSLTAQAFGEVLGGRVEALETAMVSLAAQAGAVSADHTERLPTAYLYLWPSEARFEDNRTEELETATVSLAPARMSYDAEGDRTEELAAATVRLRPARLVNR